MVYLLRVGFSISLHLWSEDVSEYEMFVADFFSRTCLAIFHYLAFGPVAKETTSE